MIAVKTGDVRKRNEVGKAIGRAWKGLEDSGLIEEPDSYNGKNGFRIPSEKGKAAAAVSDIAGAKIRSNFGREMFQPSLRTLRGMLFALATTTPLYSKP